MKTHNLPPILLGVALFILILGVDIFTVQLIFNSYFVAMTVGAILLLECLFAIWHGQQHVKENAFNNDKVINCLNLFYGAFALLSVCSIVVFTMMPEKPLDAPWLTNTRIILAILIAFLIAIGIRLLMLTFSSSNDQNPIKPTLGGSQNTYGKTGYSQTSQ